MELNFLDENGLAIVWSLIKKMVNELDEKTLKSIVSNENGVYIGTKEKYETDNTAGLIPVGTIVIITDDEEETDDITTAVLGTAKLGYMILGSGSGSAVLGKAILGSMII